MIDNYLKRSITHTFCDASILKKNEVNFRKASAISKDVACSELSENNISLVLLRFFFFQINDMFHKQGTKY